MEVDSEAVAMAKAVDPRIDLRRLLPLTAKADRGLRLR